MPSAGSEQPGWALGVEHVEPPCSHQGAAEAQGDLQGKAGGAWDTPWLQHQGKDRYYIPRVILCQACAVPRHPHTVLTPQVGPLHPTFSPTGPKLCPPFSQPYWLQQLQGCPQLPPPSPGTLRTFETFIKYKNPGLYDRMLHSTYAQKKGQTFKCTKVTGAPAAPLRPAGCGEVAVPPAPRRDVGRDRAPAPHGPVLSSLPRGWRG